MFSYLRTCAGAMRARTHKSCIQDSEVGEGEKVPHACMKSVWKAPATDRRTVMRALNSGLAIFSAASQPCHTHTSLMQCTLHVSKCMTG